MICNNDRINELLFGTLKTVTIDLSKSVSYDKVFFYSKNVPFGNVHLEYKACIIFQLLYPRSLIPVLSGTFLSLPHFANEGGDFARFAVCTGHNGFRNGDMHRYELSDAGHANSMLHTHHELSNCLLCCLENADSDQQNYCFRNSMYMISLTGFLTSLGSYRL